MMSSRIAAMGVLIACLISLPADAASLLVEAESLEHHGGWKLDTQFIHEMGSPYMLAHGLGRPVDHASGEVQLPEPGTYHVYVRTKDWVARWEAEGTPGRFHVAINGEVLEETFGDEGAEWHWEYGGAVEIGSGATEIALQDATGFDGRVDAIYFTTDESDLPPDGAEILGDWRLEKLGLSKEPTEMIGYDLVVVGGGYAGMGSAISAARMGIRVALIQNRPVLGGNGSSEVRVWSKGYIRRGKFPRIGEIVSEFADEATRSPGRAEEFGDEHKQEVVEAEPNIDLFLNHHAYAVETEENRITGVYTFDTRTSERKKFRGELFVDCTGHGTLGYLAGADWDMTPKGRMGMSNMWRWAEGEKEVEFPETTWALDLEMKDFPYPRDHHGEWFWEGGYDKDPLNDAEGIRDWNLRAVYGAFNAMKNRGGANRHKNAYLTWIAFIGGPRESRRLMGDVILTQDHIVDKHEFPDGCVPSTWTIDLHYPKEQYADTYPDNPFISYAHHDRRIDRQYGYPVPYRSFYSRNIENLFMAGRNISVTHEALGTTRVMRTCGMMGEVVGKAASICIQNDCSPRQVYEYHLENLFDLLRLPGKAYRPTLADAIVIPENALNEAGPYGPFTGVDATTLSGIVIDDSDAEFIGNWTFSDGLKGYVNYGYQYSGDKNSRAVYSATLDAAGEYEVRCASQPHENRATNVKAIIHTADGDEVVYVNMEDPPKGEYGFNVLGTFRFKAGKGPVVTLSSEGANGTVHADAIQLVRVRN